MAKKTRVKILRDIRESKSPLDGPIFIWEKQNAYGTFSHNEEDFYRTAFVLEAIEVNGKIFINAEVIFGKPRM